LTAAAPVDKLAAVTPAGAIAASAPRQRNPLHRLLYGGSVRRQRIVWFYILVSPWIAGFLLWHALPMLASLGLSLARYDGIGAPRFIGAQNYVDLVNDRLTWQALKATVLYTVGAVGVTLVGSLLPSSLLNQRLPLLGLWRTIFYLPVVTSGVAVAMLWSWLLQPDFGRSFPRVRPVQAAASLPQIHRIPAAASPSRVQPVLLRAPSSPGPPLAGSAAVVTGSAMNTPVWRGGVFR
jgi:ABC-type spermidine/putrescine transport system permease subunit II